MMRQKILLTFFLHLFLGQPAMAAEEPMSLTHRYYLSARDGRACYLEEDTPIAMTKELRRFKDLRVRTSGIWIGARLTPDHLPEGCIPPTDFFVKNAWAWQVTEPRADPRCEVCHCPEVWYFCVLSDGRPGDLKEFGYAPLGRPEQ